jgi:hypothetical protein
MKNPAVILMGLPLYVICFFSLTAFNILSLVSVFVVLITCHGVVLFWSSLFGHGSILMCCTIRTQKSRPGMGAHTYNPNYLGGGDQDLGSSPQKANEAPSQSTN